MKHLIAGVFVFAFTVTTYAQWTGQTSSTDLTSNIYRTGYVGIGTTSAPSSLLHLNSTVDARKTFRIYWNNNTTNYLSLWQGSSGAAIDPIGTGLLYLGYDQPTNVIIGSNGGSLGIGVGTPKSPLHISGSQGINWQETDNIKGSGLVTIGTPSGNGSLFINTPTHDSYYTSGLGVDGSYDATNRVSQINLKAFGVKYLSWSSSLALHTSNGTTVNEALRIDKDGKIGIGTPTPADQLEVVSSNRKVGFNTKISGINNGGVLSLSRFDDGMKTMYLGSSEGPTDDNVIFSQGGGTELRFVSSGGPYASAGFGFYINVSMQSAFGSGKPSSIPAMKIDGNGNVGIGNPNPDAKLAVSGQIHATEVRVTTTVPGPDYVFEKDYKLTSLEEIKNYIDQNKHLPEVPSAKEMEKNGVQLGEMNMLLLKKIEELTLYVIELKKENEAHKIENLNQQKQINDLKSKIK